MGKLNLMLIAPIAFAVIGSSAQVDFAQPSSGKVEHLANFGTPDVARNIDIWLPEGYTKKKKYSVLYMHDGQMLFDAKITWNKQEWEIDETLSRLMKLGKIRDCIVVGLWNRGEERYADYFPQKVLEALPAVGRKQILDMGMKGQCHSDAYLKYLVEQVKPYIDKTYSTKPDAANTFVAGSSMGGLISMYAICEYPQVFGGAACISTHWPGVGDPEGMKMCADAFNKYLASHLPDRASHKLYFDRGDQTLDANYVYGQGLVDETLKQKGWLGKQAVSMFFPGDDHSEKSWSRRFYLPALFLLGKS